MATPLEERRRLLETHVLTVKNEIMHSEQTEIADVATLQALMTRIMRENLEGLVLKDKRGTYEPAKRHWLKVLPTRQREAEEEVAPRQTVPLCGGVGTRKRWRG